MMKPVQDIGSYYPRNIEELRGKNDPEAIKAVAKEMEALFAYELIKAMREASKNSLFGKGLGNDAYTSMFDMEIAKVFAESGQLGLKEMLLKGLNKIQNSEYRIQTADLTDKTECQSIKVSECQSKSTEPRTQNTDTTAQRHRGTEAQSTGGIGQDLNPIPNPKSLIPELNMPVDGAVSSDFGMRKHPIYGDMRFHHGMDIAAPEGTDIYPIKSGKVIFSGIQGGYGNTVIIEHGDGFVSKYAHNSINRVKDGDIVDASTVIGQVGSTGTSTGPHLHFEVRHNGESINPYTLIAKR
ncbi:MAG: peptidoglycan DD-metalloendopeptidase family protein [Nitrospirae bacterium]|nr:peptidoglycan DD-metalloendopeptidase family protein [Nitrospirota bacterium]